MQAPNLSAFLIVPGLGAGIAVAAAATLLLASPGQAAAVIVGVAACVLAALGAAGRGQPDAASGESRRHALLFTILFLVFFSAVCALSLAASPTRLERAIFLVIALPLALPSSALLALALLPPSRRLAEAPALPDHALPRVSMVLATRNEPFEVVKMTLESVMEMDYPADRLELIVADNSDRAHPDFAALETYLADLAVRRKVLFIHRDGKEGAKARNLDLALAQAAGEHVLLVDADSTFAPDALRRAVAQLAHSPRTGHVQFRIGTSNWRRNFFTFCAPYLTDVLIRRVEELRSQLGFGFNGGHNVLWRRACLDEVLPFEQYIDGVLVQTEDYSASIRAALAGWRCEVLPIESWEWAPFNVSSWVKQWYRWGYGAQQNVMHYGRRVLRSERMTFGAKVGMLVAFLHFLSPTFTIAAGLWLGALTLLGAHAPTGPGCVGYATAAGSLAMLILYLRTERSHPGANLAKRVFGMIVAAVVLFGLTTWATMLSTFGALLNRQLTWTVTAKK